MRKFIIERSEDEFYTSHSGLALVGLGINRFTKLSGKLKRAMPDTKPISNIGENNSASVPLDIDVFCMDNSGTKKEGIGYTYHGYHGYAPIAAYLGEEGWCLNLEFREGSRHSQNNFIPFLQESLARAGVLTRRPLLLRLDSAHDAVETRATISGHQKADTSSSGTPASMTARPCLSGACGRARSPHPQGWQAGGDLQLQPA